MIKIFKVSIFILFAIFISSKIVFAQLTFWERTNVINNNINNIFSLVVTNNGDLWAGSDNGIYLSTNNGNTWVQKGSIRISSMAIGPSGYIFAGTGGDGLYLSADNGENWIKVDIPSLSYIYDILTTPSGEVYLGTGTGIYYSSDNGYPGTWVEKNNGVISIVFSLALGIDGTLYAGEASGVYRSTNGGDDWLQCVYTEAQVQDLTISSDGSIFAAATYRGIFKSTDKGLTWNQVNTGFRSGYSSYRIIYNPVTQHLVTGSSRIYMSTDL